MSFLARRSDVLLSPCKCLCHFSLQARLLHLTLLVSIVLQVLQRVVDAIFAAPHVQQVNGQKHIPLGTSDIRLAM